MNLILQTIIFSIIMISIDIPWIIFVMRNLYKNIFPMKLNYLAMILAYLCMVLVYPLIISKFDDIKDKLYIALISGVIIYGTYGFTLAAIYNKYPLKNAFVEVLWGGILYTLTTYLTNFLVKSFDKNQLFGKKL